MKCLTTFLITAFLGPVIILGIFYPYNQRFISVTPYHVQALIEQSLVSLCISLLFSENSIWKICQ